MVGLVGEGQRVGECCFIARLSFLSRKRTRAGARAQTWAHIGFVYGTLLLAPRICSCLLASHTCFPPLLWSLRILLPNAFSTDRRLARSLFGCKYLLCETQEKGRTWSVLLCPRCAGDTPPRRCEFFVLFEGISCLQKERCIVFSSGRVRWH